MNKLKKAGRSGRIRSLAIFIAAAAIVLAAAGGTIAWLTDGGDTLVNRFVPGAVSIKVNEDFDGTVKNNVSVENTGNVPAFIRVALVPYWVDSAGSVVGSPASLDDFEIVRSTDFDANWFIGSDGFYYCRASVAPGESTPVLIERCSVRSGNYEHDLVLHILASGIQTTPSDAVESAWSAVQIVNGRLDSR